MDADHNTKPQRPLRLPGYDYALAGAYFITFTAHRRQRILGSIVNKQLQYSRAGQIVQEELAHTSIIRPSVMIDCFVVMPDHVHCIFIITTYTATQQTSGRFTSPSRTVGAIVRAIKATATRRILATCTNLQSPIWQSRYYDHIIRDGQAFQQIRHYIEQNPANWKG
jgi:REP element-mobilizing transposase RayT